MKKDLTQSDEFSKELDSFFSSGDDSDMKKLDRKKGHNGFFIFFIIICIIGLSTLFSYLGYRYFSKEVSQDQSTGMAMHFTQSPSYPLATPTELILEIQNNDGLAQELSVLLEYPQDIKIHESVPKSANTQQTMWEFQDVKKGEKVRIAFMIVSEGSSFQEKTIRATVFYKQPGITSSFSSSATTTLKIAQPLEVFSLEGPQKAKPGARVDYVVRLKDIAQVSSEMTFVSLIMPPSFVASSVVPKNDAGNFMWSKEFLQKNQNLFTKEVVITVSGSYKEGTRGIADIRIQLVQGEKLQQKKLQEYALATNVSSQTLTLTVNLHKRDTNTPVSYGEEVQIVLHYENEGDDTLYNGEVDLEVRGPIDWKKTTSTPLSIRKNSSLTWSGKEFDRLSLIQPHDHGDIIINLALLSSQEIRQYITNPEKPFELSEYIEILAKARVAPSANSTDAKLEIASEKLTIKLNSDLSLNCRVDTIDSQTARVSCTVQNSLHEIESLHLKGTIGENITWKDSFQVTAGVLSYDTPSNTFQWSLNKLPRSVNSVDLWFDLDTATTQGKELVKALILQAKDSTTGGTLKHTYGDITYDKTE